MSVWGGHSLAVGVMNGGKWANLPTVSLPAMFFLEIYSWLSKKKKGKLERKEKIYEQYVLSMSCGFIV